MAELMTAIAALSILTSICFLMKPVSLEERGVFASEYCLAQSNALLASANETYDYSSGSVYFNENGNVTRAETVHFDAGNDIVIELGTGRLVYRE